MGTVATVVAPVEAVAQPVGDPLARRHPLHEATPRTQAQGRAQRERTGQRRRRGDAVDGDAACAPTIERAARVGDGSGRVGGVASGARRSRPRAARPATSSKRASCSSVKGWSGSSATAQWVHTASSSRPGSPTTLWAKARASSGAAPTRCIPVSTLRWTRSGVAASRPPRPRSVGRVHGRPGGRGRRRRRTRRGGARTAAGSGRRCRGPQHRALLDQGHRQPGRTPVERGPGHRDGAVAVAVGLDDGAHRGRRGPFDQEADVVGDRAEVDLGPGGPHPVRRA